MAKKGDLSTPAEPGTSKLMLWIANVALKHQGDDCLIWPFARDPSGYGGFGKEGKKQYAHRYICASVKGPPPNPKDHAAHSCDNGPGGCVSPHHLSWKSNAENQVDRWRVQRKRRRFKLTAEQAEEIRGLKGKEPTTTTAARYGVGEANVRQIQSGRVRPPGKPTIRHFTDDEVRAIRQAKGRRQVDLAAEYGTTRNAIGNIQQFRSYKDVAA